MQCVMPLAPAFGAGDGELDERTRREPRVDTGFGSADATDDAFDARPDTGRSFGGHALPDGTLIEGFRVERQIGEGGFGIVYLAWDAALERHVAIKEYMPSSLAMRAASSPEVAMRSERDRSTFDIGLKSFVNEARLLARFDHPALVKVFRFWEANGTAYMAMPYYEGPTLRAALADLHGAPTEAQLREWLDPMLDALSAIHREHCYHRDIAPDNILLTAGGPLLLDFGAARRVISDRTQPLTTMLKPGFAPIEQYGGGTMLQGPWTDLYALAGVVRYAITGRPPIASVVRVVNDTLRPLAVTYAGRYGDGFLRAIDMALSVRPEQRPQDVAAFRALLAERGVPEAEAGHAAATHPGARSPASSAVAAVAAEAPSSTAVLPVTSAPPQTGGPLTRRIETPRTEPTPAASSLAPMPMPMPTQIPTPLPVSRSRRNVLMPVLAVVLLLAVAALWWTKERVAPAVAAPVAATAPAARERPVSGAGPEWGAATTLPLPAETASTSSPSSAAVVQPQEQGKATQPQSAARALPAAPPLPIPSMSPAGQRARPAGARSEAAAINVQPPHVEAEVTSSYTERSRPPRCGELVLKSSLEPLQPDEVAFLKTQCR